MQNTIDMIEHFLRPNGLSGSPLNLNYCSTRKDSEAVVATMTGKPSLKVIYGF